VLNAYALAALGRTSEAIALLQQVAAAPLPKLFQNMVRAMLCLFEGKRSEALEYFRPLGAEATMRDPCGWYYVARCMAYLGEADTALKYLERSVTGGFFCFPWLTRDPWMDPVRHRSEFRGLLAEAEKRHRSAADAFVRAGGDRLLGVVV